MFRLNDDLIDDLSDNSVPTSIGHFISVGPVLHHRNGVPELNSYHRVSAADTKVERLREIEMVPQSVERLEADSADGRPIENHPRRLL